MKLTFSCSGTMFSIEFIISYILYINEITYLVNTEAIFIIVVNRKIIFTYFSSLFYLDICREEIFELDFFITGSILSDHNILQYYKKIKYQTAHVWEYGSNYFGDNFFK